MRLIKNLTIAAGVLALLISAPACGDDGGDDGGSSDYGDNTGGDGGDGSEGGNACTNEADQAIIDDESVDVPQITQDAAFQCLAAEDIGTCTAEDVSAQTGLSTTCVACYAEQVTCAMEFCASDCIAAPEGEECTTCRTDNCIALFEPCSGIASTTE